MFMSFSRAEDRIASVWKAARWVWMVNETLVSSGIMRSGVDVSVIVSMISRLLLFSLLEESVLLVLVVVGGINI